MSSMVEDVSEAEPFLMSVCDQVDLERLVDGKQQKPLQEPFALL